MRRRLSGFFYRHRSAKLAALLSPPLLWIVLVYLLAMVALLLTAFGNENSVTARVEYGFSLDNFKVLWNDPVNRTITLRTVGMALIVTVTDIALAFPLAYYMVRIASGKMKALLFVGILMPLWSSYLIKAYTWRLITAQDGPINWALGKVGLGSVHLAFTYTAMWLVYVYLWLPYMILPVYAALERVSGSYLEASGDLGAKAWTTFRRVTMPLALPGIAAGSIFTFSLTLGDYIAPDIVGGNLHQFIGNVIFQQQGVAQDLPLAAAFAFVPIVIVILYLVVMNRLGAFEAL
jgi:putative spermidine/putrescine transport system permease protein